MIDKNLDLIKNIQEDMSMTFQTSPNKFLDLQYNDFLKMHTGYVASKPPANQVYYTAKNIPVPDELDHRLKGISTPVKN